MKTINANGNELIVVEVPDDANGFNVTGLAIYFNSNNWDGKRTKTSECRGYISLDNDSKEHEFLIIGLLRYLTESDCERLVEKVNSDSGIYRNYQVITFVVGFKTAKESLISLLQSHGIDTSKNLILLTKNKPMNIEKAYFDVNKLDERIGELNRLKSIHPDLNKKITELAVVDGRLDENKSSLEMAKLHMDGRAILIFGARINTLLEQREELIKQLNEPK